MAINQATSNMSNLIEKSNSVTTNVQTNKKTSSNNNNKKKQQPTEYDVFKIKNKIITDLTHAIQLVQKCFLEKDDDTNKQMTNSDYQVHELCYQLDLLFLFGLKRPDESYWSLIKEFTHKNFIQDINRLLNVTTCFGRSRAWLYHALNENLMESYLRYIYDDTKLVLQFYFKDCSIITDRQDVLYLDESCWPTHFNAKRIYLDSLLNSSSSLPNNSNNNLKSIQTSEPTNKTAKKTTTNLSKTRKRRNRPVNNITLDDNPPPVNVKPYLNKNQYRNKDTSDDDEVSTSRNIESESLNCNPSDDDYNERNDEDDSDDIYTSSKDTEQTRIIDDEIDKLRRVSLIITNKKKNSKLSRELQIQSNPNSSSNSSFLSNNNTINNQDLLASSLKVTHHFDKKIEDLENYSQIIEDATLNMGNYLKDIKLEYNLEHCNSTNDDETTPVAPSNLQEELVKFDFQNSPKKEVDLNNKEFNTSMHSDIDFYNNMEAENIDNLTSTSENLTNESSTNTSHIIDIENNYLVNTKFEIKQEIKVDTNLKLVLMINVFQNGENEQLFKFYTTSRGHNQGEIEKIYLLISSHGIYVLVRNDSIDMLVDESKSRRKSTVSLSSMSNTNEISFRKEMFVSHSQLDYVEVGLESQTIHMACMNKRQSFWITTASRLLTENYLDAIQKARQSNYSRLLPLSVFHEATQQRLALTKFLANEEKLNTQDIRINKYQLVYWEDQNSSTNYLIHKEGALAYFNKSSNSSNLEWKTGYFILKNDVLTQYKSSHDKRPSQIIKLNGEDFLNCRKNNNTSRPNTIELIFSSGNTFYLSAKTDTDAIDWLQIFCRVISLGNIDTDVPAYSCVPCCTVITVNKIYFCHEDLTTGFYRLLEAIKLQEINRISFDNDHPYYCILHEDIDNKKGKYWFVYFVDENERNHFITGFKEAWEMLFQVPLTVERCKSSELRNRCIRSINLIHNEIYGD